MKVRITFDIDENTRKAMAWAGYAQPASYGKVKAHIESLVRTSLGITVSDWMREGESHD